MFEVYQHEMGLFTLRIMPRQATLECEDAGLGISHELRAYVPWLNEATDELPRK